MRATNRSGPSPHRWLALSAVAVLAGLFSSGCRTYTQQNTTASVWQNGRYDAAALEYSQKAEKERNGKDALIWRLEQGAALRASGKIRESLAAFDQAEQKINAYEESARVKVANEAGAILSNQANLPYEGRAYDKVMVNLYKALNYLQLGEYDKARVEFFRTYQRQRDAVELNRKRIAQTQEELNRKGQQEKELTERARTDPGFGAMLKNTYGPLDNLQAYSDYVNPAAVYLDALFFLCQATGGSDLERASKSFDRVRSMVGDTRFIRQDLELVARVIKGTPIPPTTYVFYETGLAPIRQQIRIDIPILFARVSYVGAAFPTIEFLPNTTPSLHVVGNGVSEASELVCSMDSVIGREFKNELPGIITKTIFATVAKGVAAYGLNAAADRQDAMLGLLSRLVTAGYQLAVNIADCRTWTTLPKEFQVCRFPTPADRRLQIMTTGGQRVDLTLEPGAVNVVWIRGVNAGVPLSVSQIKLK